jgi:hypothetical protein
VSIFKDIDKAWMSLPEETQIHTNRKSFELAWLMRDSEVRQLRKQLSDMHLMLIETSEQPTPESSNEQR